MITLPSEVKNVLVAPLNWGLGHACRCIPLIQFLISNNKQVFIASDGESLNLLRKEFPELSFFNLPSYNIKYKSSNLYAELISNGPGILSAIKREHIFTAQLIAENNIDYIISDSRFGVYHPKVHSVILSHQLKIRIKNKLISLVLNRLNTSWLKNFDACWIPDFETRKLTGELSNNDEIKNKIFIGPLSSLKIIKGEEKYALAIILSGPEPARSKLEQKLLRHIDLKGRIILVRGTSVMPDIETQENWDVKQLATRQEVNEIVSSSRCIISRSGYTSIMDYEKIKAKAILIPTPGQIEQEYLASLLQHHNRYQIVFEKDLDTINSKIIKIN